MGDTVPVLTQQRNEHENSTSGPMLPIGSLKHALIGEGAVGATSLLFDSVCGP